MFFCQGTRVHLTRGDTALLTVAITGAELTQKDRVVMTIRRLSGATVAEKVGVPENNRVQFPFLHEETEGWKEGEYMWDVRVVLDAQLDEKGRVINGREVVTPMRAGVWTMEKAVGKI